jgi:hypothetical protein
MDIFIYVILVGAAASYLVELLALVDSFNPKIIRLVTTLPLCYFGCWLFDIIGFQLVVCGFSAAFVSGVLSMLVNRPVVVNNYNRR